MRELFVSVLAAALFFSLGLVLSCGDDDDDDDDAADDDAADDDDADDDDADDDVDDDDATDTWTDSVSGLTWQVTPSGDLLTIGESNPYCDNLTLAGGGWRLPTISELRSLIRGCDDTMTAGACTVTDECASYADCNDAACDGCDDLAGPGSGGAYWPEEMSGEINYYWSSSEFTDYGYGAWLVGFFLGDFGGYFDSEGGAFPARCVR